MFSAQALRPHLCFVCARIFAIHTAAPHAAHTKSVQALSCFRINDCRAAHTVCQRFQNGKSFPHSGFTDSGTEQFFFRCRPSFLLCCRINLVQRQKRAAGDSLMPDRFHLELDKIRRAAVMFPGTVQHGNHLLFHAVLCYNPLRSGNMLSAHAVGTAKTGTHFHAVQYLFFSHNTPPLFSARFRTANIFSKCSSRLYFCQL